MPIGKDWQLVWAFLFIWVVEKSDEYLATKRRELGTQVGTREIVNVFAWFGSGGNTESELKWATAQIENSLLMNSSLGKRWLRVAGCEARLLVKEEKGDPCEEALINAVHDAHHFLRGQVELGVAEETVHLEGWGKKRLEHSPTKHFKLQLPRSKIPMRAERGESTLSTMLQPGKCSIIKHCWITASINCIPRLLISSSKPYCLPIKVGKKQLKAT